MLSGIAAAFSSSSPPDYLSDLFSTVAGPLPDRHRPFPEDGPFLSAQEVTRLREHAPLRWTPARCEAHLDLAHPIARRASVSWFVWQHFQNKPQMSLAELRDWVELDLLTKALTPQSWAQHRATAEGQTLDSWWATFTHQHRADLITRHAATIRRIQTYS